MAEDLPPFSTIAIAGVGLIGGSIALGLRERWPSVRVVGVDRPAVLAHAIGGGAIDTGVERLVDVGPVDLVVLAAPVRQNARLLAELASAGGPAPPVTDVGGTKGDIVRAARTLSMGGRFIGGHPVGGAEKGGFGFARPDLFKDRAWVFTPDAGAPPALLDSLFTLARALGARPASMEAEAHDRLMAFVSHLPQLTASALMDVAGSAAAADGLRFAGKGLADTTRLASSPADVWRDICLTNAEAVGEALEQLIDRLVELRADLRRGEVIDQVFGSAARWRGELMKGRE